MKSDQLNEPKLPQEDVPESAVRRQMLKSFGWFTVATVGGFGVYEWLTNSPKLYGIRKPFRQLLNANEAVSRTYFSNNHLVQTFPPEEAARPPRVNGYEGIKTPIPDDWKLQIDRSNPNGGLGTPLLLTMADIKALPKHEIVYDFKCIEGWSQVQHWGGVRLSDFLAKYKLGTRNGDAPDPDKPENLFKHVGMETPDKGYYVGIDIESALHPQTLLAYEMNGQPIDARHGAPVRLIIPVKYGVKNLKRIGRIFFSDERPRDFWTERGYDYYVGL